MVAMARGKRGHSAISSLNGVGSTATPAFFLVACRMIALILLLLACLCDNAHAEAANTSEDKMDGGTHETGASPVFMRVPGDVIDGTEMVPFDASWIKTGNKARREKRRRRGDRHQDHESSDPEEDEPAGVDLSQFPLALHPPDFVPVFQYAFDNEDAKAEASYCSSNSTSQSEANDSSCVETEASNAATSRHTLVEVGRAARQLLDEILPSSRGAVLLRGLDKVIHNTEDFTTFWDVVSSFGEGWTPTPYFFPRPKLQGVDLAYSGQRGLNEMAPPHIEHMYTPRPNGRIMFYCLQHDSLGGESLLTPLLDASAIPDAIMDHVAQAGGVSYRQSIAKHTWQRAANTTSRDEAVKWYAKHFGYAPEKLAFNKFDTLFIRHSDSGLVRDGEHSRLLWRNKLHYIANNQRVGAPPLADGALVDGTMFPKSMADTVFAEILRNTSVLRLRPGDWLVIDNLRMMHGRLPIRKENGQERTILTVYTE